MRLAPNDILPSDVASGTFIGRVWLDGPDPGPRPVVLPDSELSDLSGLAPTVSDLFELPHLVEQIHSHPGARLCSLEQALQKGNLLAPCDLQAIKACGVTFASSLLERIIEEKARGNPDEAKTHRPDKDRDGPGSGFTHKPGDRVDISSARLGTLVNEIVYSDRAPPWIFGARALARSLAARGVL